MKILQKLSALAVAAKQLTGAAARYVGELQDRVKKFAAAINEAGAGQRSKRAGLHRGRRVMSRQARRVAYLSRGRTVRMGDLKGRA